MKKHFIRIISCALAAAAIMSMSACGSTTAGSPESAVSSVSSTASVVSSETSSSAAANGLFATVADFVNSEAMQTQLESMKSDVEEMGMSIDVTGEDNKLIYTFTYADLGDTDVEALSESLASAVDQMADTYESIAAALAEMVGVDNPTVVVKYVTADGAELCAKEFTAAE